MITRANPQSPLATSAIAGPGLQTGSVLGRSVRRTLAEAVIPLGPVGRCSGKATLVIFVVDDSASVASPGGNDPVSNRYTEIRLALDEVAKRCRCGRELAAVLHFDSPHGDSAVQPLSRAGLRALDASLCIPIGGMGSSSLLPSMAGAQHLAQDHQDHEIVLVILSDFWLTDLPITDAWDRLSTFPGTVIAVRLGTFASVTVEVPGVRGTVHISCDSPAGATAQAVLRGLTLHRLLHTAGRRRSFHNALIRRPWPT